jgi:hypothetical protein
MSPRFRRLLAASALLAIALGVAVSVVAAADTVSGKQRFLIMMPHTKEQCLKALDDMSASATALLAKTEWGCMAGDHTGYAIVDAPSEQAAREMVPPAERASSKIISLNKFTPEQIKAFHHK